MAQLLGETGHIFTTRADRGAALNRPQPNSPHQDVPQDMKEKLCRVALDYGIELKNAIQSSVASYTLPDGNVISLGKPCIM